MWRWYNKRCNVENKIDELKTGLALDQMSQQHVIPNAAFAWVKGLTYNLLNWFKELLPQEVANCEVPTIRRRILQVPGNIVGNGRYRHLKLAPNVWLERVITVIKEKLTDFVYRRTWVSVLVTL